MYPDLRVVFSASSLLNILNADADLSRRCIPYEMQGLSFREFMLFYKQLDLPICTLEEVLNSPGDICSRVNEVCRPLAFFQGIFAVWILSILFKESDGLLYKY